MRTGRSSTTRAESSGHALSTTVTSTQGRRASGSTHARSVSRLLYATTTASTVAGATGKAPCADRRAGRVRSAFRASGLPPSRSAGPRPPRSVGRERPRVRTRPRAPSRSDTGGRSGWSRSDVRSTLASKGRRATRPSSLPAQNRSCPRLRRMERRTSPFSRSTISTLNSLRPWIQARLRATASM